MKARTCSICEQPLKWWNTHSCVKCGMNICKWHACTIRRSRSSILFTFCKNCALNAAKGRVINPNSLPGELRTNKEMDSLTSSLSGISLSGISFSGLSLSGISFSGIKREQNQRDEQPDHTDTNQTKQSHTPSRETPIPPTEQPQNDEQTD